ncbi:MAG: hypothetical protein ABSE06_15575 [Anaerolineaceae bacterium]
MRSIMRSLLLGAVVFGGLLLSGSRPDTPIQPTYPIGFFWGTYDFVLISKTHVFKEGADGDTVLSDEHIAWIGDGTINLRTPGYVQATAGLLKNNVDITQAGDITGTAPTGNCDWSETLLASGEFGNSWTNFNWSAQSWDTSLLWNKITDFRIVSASGSGSIPKFCKSAGVKTADEQKEAVEAETRSIKKIRFTMTPSSLFDMKGNCSLPNWVGKIAIPDGWSERSDNKCRWELFPVESQQWKNPSKIGK